MGGAHWASRKTWQGYQEVIGKDCRRLHNKPGMARTFRLPDLGEGLHEAQIVEWHVNEGDDVTADTPLVSVETDKAVTEIPSRRMDSLNGTPFIGDPCSIRISSPRFARR